MTRGRPGRPRKIENINSVEGIKSTESTKSTDTLQEKSMDVIKNEQPIEIKSEVKESEEVKTENPYRVSIPSDRINTLVCDNGFFVLSKSNELLKFADLIKPNEHGDRILTHEDNLAGISLIKQLSRRICNIDYTLTTVMFMLKYYYNTAEFRIYRKKITEPKVNIHTSNDMTFVVDFRMAPANAEYNIKVVATKYDLSSGSWIEFAEVVR